MDKISKFHEGQMEVINKAIMPDDFDEGMKEIEIEDGDRDEEDEYFPPKTDEEINFGKTKEIKDDFNEQ